MNWKGAEVAIVAMLPFAADGEGFFRDVWRDELQDAKGAI